MQRVRPELLRDAPVFTETGRNPLYGLTTMWISPCIAPSHPSARRFEAGISGRALQPIQSPAIRDARLTLNLPQTGQIIATSVPSVGQFGLKLFW